MIAEHLQTLRETERTRRFRKFGRRIALYGSLTDLYGLLSGIVVGLIDRERNEEHGFCDVARTKLSHAGLRVAECAQIVGGVAETHEQQQMQ